MPRDCDVYLADILDAVEKILRYTSGMSLDGFRTDEKTMDAVVRNLEIIGEAAKRVPHSVRDAHADIEWKKICGMRDMLIHAYFGVEPEIVFDIVRQKLPGLERRIREIIIDGME